MVLKISDNTPVVKFMSNNQIMFVNRMLLEDAHQYSNPITPKDTGDLRARVKKVVHNKQGVIQWNIKYAAYQENPRRKFKYTTPGTGPHYAEKGIRHAMSKLGEHIRKT